MGNNKTPDNLVPVIYSSDFGGGYDGDRHDMSLAKSIDAGDKVTGRYSDKLAVRWLTRGTRFYIHDYDGCEQVITEDEQRWRTA